MRTLLLLSLTLVPACGASPKRDTSPVHGAPVSQSETGQEPPADVHDLVLQEEQLPPIQRLRVRAPVLNGYNRKDWKHWTDEDHDCQDTRQEVLIAESEVPVTFKTERKCKVLRGQWTCPYTGETFTDPRKLDVDHMVPLGAAHAAGGHAWDTERRRAFANELGVAHHLIAVKASANRSKGKRGPDEWLPSNVSYICEYAWTWTDIKAKWGLAVSAEENIALREQLGKCPVRWLVAHWHDNE